MNLGTFICSIVLSMAVLFAPLTGWAQSNDSFVAAAPAARLNVDLSVYKVSTRPDGQEWVEPAVHVVPGDLLEYRAVYRNAGDRTARDTWATLPVPPADVVYESATHLPPPLQASLDGKSFESLPIKRTVVRPNGVREEQLVPVHEFRALRWRLGDLPPGKSAMISARMRLTTGGGVSVAAAR